MIVRNINQKEVLDKLYRAHGGGVAAMLLDTTVLNGILFLAHGVLKPGKVIEPHVDPYEEIYYVLEGQAVMLVEDEKRRVWRADAIWIPHDSVHGLENDSDEECMILIIAAMPRAT
jgi:quercetin dioxygenase-like cupin family protein